MEILPPSQVKIKEFTFDLFFKNSCTMVTLTLKQKTFIDSMSVPLPQSKPNGEKEPRTVVMEITETPPCMRYLPRCL